MTLVAVGGFALSTASAQTLHWDINGNAAGSGGISPAGNWDLTTAHWNDTLGTGSPTLWGNTGLETAVFSAGSDAIGSYSVTLAAGVALNLTGLTVNAGNVTLSPQAAALDTLNFGIANALVNVAAGSNLLIQAASTGSAGLTKTGAGVLEFDAASTASGAYTISAGEFKVANGRTLNASSLSLGGLAGASSTLTLGAGAVLELGGNISFLNANAPLGATLQGAGTVRLNGTRTISVQNIATDPDLTISTVLTDGTVSSGIDKTGASTLLLSGANAYTGETNVSSGTLLVQGSAGSIASSSAVNVAATSVLTLGELTDTTSVDRLGNAATISLNGAAAGGANFNLNGPNLTVAGTHVETIGTLQVAGDHRSVITLQAGAGDQVELNAAALSRTGKAVGLVRGSLLGSTSGTVDSARVFFQTAPELTGGILPWLLVDANATGSGTAFATYDATQGLRAQTDTVAPASAVAGSNVVKSAGGAVPFNTSTVVNSWTNSATGTTTIGSGVTLGVSSGAFLFTATGTLTGGTIDLGTVNQGIIHISSAVAITATINSTITGSQGIVVSGNAANANRVLSLGGNNTFTGGFSIYTGQVQLTSVGALNASGVNALTVQAGGTLRLNGQTATVSGLSGTGTVNNSSTTTASVLRVNGGGTFNGTLVDGAAGTLGLTKAGNGTLILGGNNTLTGPVIVANGVLQLNPTGGNPGTNGQLTQASSVQILQGATLQINKGNGAGSSNNERLGNAIPITLAGGTLTHNVNANNIAYAETVGTVTLANGASQISSGQAGATGTSAFIVTGLAARSTGATLNFTGGGLGTSMRNRLEIGGLSAGFLGGWATVGGEFAKYVEDVDATLAGNQSSVTAFVAADYVTTNANDASNPWSSSSHVKPASDQGTSQGLNVSREVNSVNLAAMIDLTLGAGVTLNVVSGGVIKQGGTVNGTGTSVSQINGGILTAGGSQSNAELFVRVTGANLTIGSEIQNNGAGGIVALVKTGAGTLNLNAANAHAGGVFLNEGTLRANNTTGSATGTGSVVTRLGTVLGGTGFIAPAADQNITLQGTLAVGNLGDTVARDLGIAVSGSGQLTLNETVLLDLFNNANNGTLNPSTAADLLEVDAASWDRVTLGGNSTLRVVTSLISTNFIEGDSWKLFDWSGIAGGTAPTQGVNGFAALDLPLLAGGLQWDTSQLFTSGVIVVAVPEPSRVLLLGLGGIFILLRRRPRHDVHLSKH